MFYLNDYKVPGLRHICEVNGLYKYGNRDQLINRIVTHFSEKKRYEERLRAEQESYRQQILDKKRINDENEQNMKLIYVELEQLKAKRKLETQAKVIDLFNDAKREIEEESKARRLSEIQAYNELLLDQARIKNEEEKQHLKRQIDIKTEDMIYRERLLEKALKSRQ